MTHLTIVTELLERHGWLAGKMPEPSICTCDHELQGTGVFYQSVGLIYCPECKGYQLIKRPIK